MKRRFLNKTRSRVFKRSIWQTRLVFWGGAMMVGLTAAMFARVADYADLKFHAFASENPYLPLVITPLGLLLITFLVRRLFDGAQGSGVPQTLVMMSRGGDEIGRRFLNVRVIVGKLLLCIAGLLSGAVVGRIGPTVHIGAAIMVSLGKYMHFQREYVLKGLIMAGGGAGIAAAFNLPIAGIMFAIEQMGRSFDRRNIGMILIAIILAGLVATLIHDVDYHFDVHATTGEDYLLLGIIVVACSVVCGLLGGLFSRVLIFCARRLFPLTRRHWVISALACGVVIAFTGLLSGGVAYGSGYIETQKLLACVGQAACEDHPGLLYPFYKMIATAATFISGIPAGIFMPVLATGTGLGSDLATLFPPELAMTVVLVSMVAYYSGVMQTPITAFIVVIEMSGNNELIFALMAAALIASGSSKLVCRQPLFNELARNIMRSLSHTPAK